ncbi:hypothetical protein [Acetomicrobium flavidum]|uniref:hypothetical protein n=1 Tax=Acetomicrobium flavidum TaxID=49896 RepID=UPI00346128CA
MRRCDYDEKGWSRHQHFGLRKEWLEFYLSDREGWRQNSTLGNRQVDSFATWLKTAGIEDKKGNLTALGMEFIRRGVDDLSLWELLWVNVVFSFPTARWYAHLGLGTWSTTELKAMLEQSVPRLAERTVINAIMELAGLLERTPVGKELGQGHVGGNKPRRISRIGREPNDSAIIHSIGKLYLQQDRTILPWSESLAWPWVVFGCSLDSILERLIKMDQDYFMIDDKGIIICRSEKEEWQCGDIAISWL